MPTLTPRILITMGILVVIIGFILSEIEAVSLPVCPGSTAQNCFGGGISHSYLLEGILLFLIGIALVVFGFVRALECELLVITRTKRFLTTRNLNSNLPEPV